MIDQPAPMTPATCTTCRYYDDRAEDNYGRCWWAFIISAPKWCKSDFRVKVLVNPDDGRVCHAWEGVDPAWYAHDTTSEDPA